MTDPAMPGPSLWRLLPLGLLLLAAAAFILGGGRRYLTFAQLAEHRAFLCDIVARGGILDDAVFLEAASAKIRAGEAAAEGAAIAHQVFGAIGFTNEHVLHRFTLRMLSWRDDFGNESHWAAELGRRVARGGADAFWTLVASR